MSYLLSLFATGAAGAEGAQAGGNQYSSLIFIVLLFVVMYFLMIRPQKKRQKEEQEMRQSLEIGDEIVTIGGIVGRVVTIREEDIVIETGADRTKIKFKRWAVNTNVTKTEQHRKEVEAARAAAQEKKNSKKAAKEEKHSSEEPKVLTDDKED